MHIKLEDKFSPAENNKNQYFEIELLSKVIIEKSLIVPKTVPKIYDGEGYAVTKQLLTKK